MPTASDWYLIISAGGGGTCVQIAFSLFGGNMYHRYCATNNWSIWVKLFNLSGTTLTIKESNS